jgi:hypothetical protein
MGTRTDQAEREVNAQRARITQMIDDLEQRARTDVEGVEHGIAERASALKGRATGTIGAFGERVPTGEVAAQVERHPLSSIVLGFGAGIALGVLSGSVTGNRDRVTTTTYRPRPLSMNGNTRPSEASDDESGLVSSMLGSISMSTLNNVLTPVREEVQTMVRQAVVGFLGTERERAEPAPRAAVDREDRSERRVRERDQGGGTVERESERRAG